ncbi:MAG: hypothetical protein JWM85_390 [Acidimicrobiaceae bacterium]|nr:hypothetical protein [Acidimicrobiaceae bacterium]
MTLLERLEEELLAPGPIEMRADDPAWFDYRLRYRAIRDVERRAQAEQRRRLLAGIPVTA